MKHLRNGTVVLTNYNETQAAHNALVAALSHAADFGTTQDAYAFLSGGVRGRNFFQHKVAPRDRKGPFEPVNLTPTEAVLVRKAAGFMLSRPYIHALDVTRTRNHGRQEGRTNYDEVTKELDPKRVGVIALLNEMDKQGVPTEYPTEPLVLPQDLAGTGHPSAPNVPDQTSLA